MPKSTDACNKILALIFNATTWDTIAENDSTSPATNLYLALHTAAPVGNDQSSNEAAYTNYARVAVVRTTSGWAVPSGGETENAALVQFAQCGASGATITHVSLGTGSSGATPILYSGALNSALAVANLIQPQFSAGALTVAET